MSTRGTKGKNNGGRSTTDSTVDTSNNDDAFRFNANAGKPAQAAVPAAPSSVTPLDPSAGRKASTDLVTQQQLALLATQFLSTARNFTDVDIDISQDADMLALAKSRVDSGLALIGLLEPHVSTNRDCKVKFTEIEVACFKIASKCGAQPWAQRYVSNYRAGAPSSTLSTAAAAAAAAAVSDASSPIMTLASAAAASSAVPPSSTTVTTARPLTAPSAFPMLTQPFQGLSNVSGNNVGGLPLSSMGGLGAGNHNINMSNLTSGNNGMPMVLPTSERFVVLGRNQKPREKKPNEVSIPGKGRKKVSPLEMRGKSSNVLSSAMYSIQTHAKNGGKISIMLSEAFRRRNDERRNKRKRKFGEVDAAVNKSLLGNNNNNNNANNNKEEEDDDSEDEDERRAAFFQAARDNASSAAAAGRRNNNNSNGGNNSLELQQLEAEMMQAFDATLQSIRRFREARGDFQVPDEDANYFAAFAAPDGRFYGEQGNVQKGEYELLMQLFEALHGKPSEQWCRFSATKTKYNTFKCPFESFGVTGEDGEDDNHHGNNNIHLPEGIASGYEYDGTFNNNNSGSSAAGGGNAAMMSANF